MEQVTHVRKAGRILVQHLQEGISASYEVQQVKPQP